MINYACDNIMRKFEYKQTQSIFNNYPKIPIAILFITDSHLEGFICSQQFRIFLL